MTAVAPVIGGATDAAEGWVDVCAFDALVPDRGVCALVEGLQVALFRTAPDDALFAVSNYDPYSGAFVMSRGLVGTAGGRLKVASPMYKQCFDLATGECLSDPDVRIPTYRVRAREGRVQVAVA